MFTKSLPVLMHHYVSRVPSTIAVHPEIFDNQCEGMAKNGWRGISLKEAEAYLLEGRPLPKRSALITFDDGYLDNYVNAWQILQKHGHNAVIFTNTARLDGGEAREIDAALKESVDCRGKSEASGDRYFNWQEARLMEESGVIDIASHTAHHYFRFSSGDLPPPSADLALRFKVPDRFREDERRFRLDLPWGMPLFPLAPEMGGKAFIPSQELIDAVVSLVPQDKYKASEFFQSPENVKRLSDLTSALKNRGRMESEEEARERMRSDLLECASDLRRKLGHSEVLSHCWCWGFGSSMAQEEAAKLGYRVFFETTNGANPPGNASAVHTHTHTRANPPASAVHRFKVRNKPYRWLKTRLFIYSRPIAAEVYRRLKG
ncbi:MAG: polysaccharide deacetylase family protein [Helicobacteraceae bacterium]|jgi:peptidoglycan/xylan/chitin deacetylase (PgdA/CDA1 family)|nr:polysaccharide deacetylase family protein [Helicobacteraceae bacterium]